MDRRFSRHFSREVARALLPEIRGWLAKLRMLQPVLEQQERGLARLLGQGRDLGGERVNGWLRTSVALQSVVREFANRQIQVKDVQRGLLDFPAIVDGREVFLCWEEGEEALEFWHELDGGIAGRARL